MASFPRTKTEMKSQEKTRARIQTGKFRVSASQRRFAELHERFGCLHRPVIPELFGCTPEAARMMLRRLKKRGFVQIHNGGPFTYSALTEAGARRFGLSAPRPAASSSALFVRFAIAEFAATLPPESEVLTRDDFLLYLQTDLSELDLVTPPVLRRRWVKDAQGHLTLIEVDTSSSASGASLVARIATRLSSFMEAKPRWRERFEGEFSVTVLSARELGAELAVVTSEGEFGIPIRAVRTPVLSLLEPREATE